MTRPVVNLFMLGRFGNQLFQYAFAKAYTEQNNCELRCDPWVGEALFDLPEPNRVSVRFNVTRSDLSFIPGETNIELHGYFQSQASLIYTREWVRNLYRWKQSRLNDMPIFRDSTVAHLRRGDYFGYGYPVVSRRSYEHAAEQFSLPIPIIYVSEESGYPYEFDFYRLSQADYMLRANSSFSWWAAVLGKQGQRVFSPVIDGLEGGHEHDVAFVEGNHPRFCNLPFVTDLKFEP